MSDLFDLFGLRLVVARDPAFHLPFQKALRATDTVEARYLPVHLVQLHQRVAHRLRKTPAQLWRGFDLFGKRVVYHDPAPALHYVEGSPNHGLVLAEEIRRRGEREVGMQTREDREFPAHVVRLRRHRPQGGTTENTFPVPDLKEVR